MSESGAFCHVDGAQGRGDRLLRSFILPILINRTLVANTSAARRSSWTAVSSAL